MTFSKWARRKKRAHWLKMTGLLPPEEREQAINVESPLEFEDEETARKGRNVLASRKREANSRSDKRREQHKAAKQFERTHGRLPAGSRPTDHQQSIRQAFATANERETVFCSALSFRVFIKPVRRAVLHDIDHNNSFENVVRESEDRFDGLE